MKKIIAIALFASAFVFIGCSGDGQISSPRINSSDEEVDVDDINLNDIDINDIQNIIQKIK